MKEILEFYQKSSPQDIALFLSNVTVFAWIGCWLATRTMGRPAGLWRVLPRGILGGALGALLNPLHVVLIVYALSRNGITLIQLTASALTHLVEGAVLSLPLAIFIGVHKARPS